MKAIGPYLISSFIFVLIGVAPANAAYGIPVEVRSTANSYVEVFDADKRRPAKGVAHLFHAGNSTVSLSGRVLTPGGRSIRNATIILMDIDGPTQVAVSGSLGYYSFTGIIPGRTYVLGVFHPRYLFASPTQTIEINADQTGVILIGEEDWL